LILSFLAFVTVQLFLDSVTFFIFIKIFLIHIGVNLLVHKVLIFISNGGFIFVI